jgi:hypothetical protein
LANQDKNPCYVRIYTDSPVLIAHYLPCMAIPTGIVPIIDDRRVEGSTDDRRVAVTPRRGSPRYRTFKGAQIFWPWPLGAHDECIVRNLSETGACLEIHVPVLHQTFDLAFDHEQSHCACCVVWRKEPRAGVKFR